MQCSKKQAHTLRKALEYWQNQELITSELRHRLESTLEVSPFDWQRLARYAMWAGMACLLITLGSVLYDESLLQWLFRLPHSARASMAATLAAVFYAWVSAAAADARRKSIPTRRCCLWGAL